MDVSADLAFAFSLADAADAISNAHFRSEALRTTTKGDGTAVSAVDLAVEEAMLALVRGAFPHDAILGEEVGAHSGSSGRRWIFDGIDGTHNYAAGRPGWATIVALEVDGIMTVGVVSGPTFGSRWFASKGAGAWTATHSVNSPFDLQCATPMNCTATQSLVEASVIVAPSEGLMHGWRNEVAQQFVPPKSPRSQSFAIDAAMVAAGEVDAALLTLGGVWDYAATSLIVREAGGVFYDAWGGTRLDTTTAVFTNARLSAPMLDVLAKFRPDVPDGDS
jgi:histidinol-phosphatase